MITERTWTAFALSIVCFRRFSLSEACTVADNDETIVLDCLVRIPDTRYGEQMSLNVEEHIHVQAKEHERSSRDPTNSSRESLCNLTLELELCSLLFP